MVPPLVADPMDPKPEDDLKRLGITPLAVGITHALLYNRDIPADCWRSRVVKLDWGSIPGVNPWLAGHGPGGIESPLLDALVDDFYDPIRAKLAAKGRDLKQPGDYVAAVWLSDLRFLASSPDKDWPHTCPKCKRAKSALILFRTIECRFGCYESPTL